VEDFALLMPLGKPQQHQNASATSVRRSSYLHYRQEIKHACKFELIHSRVPN